MSTERESIHASPEPLSFRTPIAHTEVHTGPGGSLLIGAGATLLIVATGMLLLPRIAPGQTWIVRDLAARGLTVLPLFAAGMLFTGLWLAVRTSRAHSIAAQLAAMSAAPAIDALGGELIRLHEDVRDLRLEFVYVKDALQAHFERHSQPQADTHSESMYRLAASLDQLGQRVQEQLDEGHRKLHEGLEAITSAVELARYEDREGRYQFGVSTSRPGHPVDSSEGLPANGEHPFGHIAESASSSVPSGRERLGVLDLLDDLGRMLPKSGVEEPASGLLGPNALENVGTDAWKLQDQVAGALPSVRFGEEFDLTSAGDLLASEHEESDSDELDVVRKLEELRSLLADSRVRDALTTLDRFEE